MLFVVGFMSSLLWIFLFAGVGLLMIFMNQDFLVYSPQFPPEARTTFLLPADFGLIEEELFVPTEDGEKLQCWLFKTEQPKKNPTWIFFHGNAGNISYRLENIKEILERLTCNVLIVSYRGYGRSTGKANEIGLKLDASAVLKKVKTMSELDPNSIILFGRSLGGAVAVDLAAHCCMSESSPPLLGVILENTFSSINQMQTKLFPLLSYYGFLCTNGWSSMENIQHINIPVLFISGGNDELIAPEMMESLRDACKSRKQWKFFPNGTHMETWKEPNYYPSIKEWLSEIRVNHLNANPDTANK